MYSVSDYCLRIGMSSESWLNDSERDSAKGDFQLTRPLVFDSCASSRWWSFKISLRCFLNAGSGRGLVRMSATISVVWQYSAWSLPVCTFSLMKWYLISMCLVLDLLQWFFSKNIAPWLSWNKMDILMSIRWTLQASPATKLLLLKHQKRPYIRLLSWKVWQLSV